MRITNQIMQNNAINNVQVNKRQMNTLDTQLSTQKKINRPSEDPIIAIRALRLRTSLNEVTQYLKKNIPDANSWLDVTEGALTEANDIISDIYNYCVQGSTDTQSTNERKVISDAIKELRSAFYSQGDVDYAGRYVFTGYKTDMSLTFTTDEEIKDASYNITESFDPATDFDSKIILENPVDIVSIKAMTSDEIGALDDAGVKDVADLVGIDTQSTHRIRLSYSDVVDNGVTLGYTNADGDYTALDDKASYTSDKSAVPGDDEILINTDTGEILFGQNVYEEIFTAGGKLSVNYSKDKFVMGDVRPEHYFNCTNLSNGVKYETSEKDEDINYIINFNQKIKVNSQAKDCFSVKTGRDIDDLISALDATIEAEDKLETLKSIKSNPNYADEAAQKNIDRLIAAATKEVEMRKDTLQKQYEKGITQMQTHQHEVDTAISDVGNRMARLKLTETRLEDQKINFTNLKSQNEDIELEDVVINYTAAQQVYTASLTASSKVVRQTLLDFIS